MAIVTIPHNPELTAEQAMEAFAKHFAGKYGVCKAQQLRRDFVVKKSAWSGVGVRLQQQPDKTSFVFTGTMPNPVLRILFSGLVSYLVLRSQWTKLEAEVAQFIETAPEFHPKPKAKRQPRRKISEAAA